MTDKWEESVYMIKELIYSINVLIFQNIHHFQNYMHIIRKVTIVKPVERQNL